MVPSGAVLLPTFTEPKNRAAGTAEGPDTLADGVGVPDCASAGWAAPTTPPSSASAVVAETVFQWPGMGLLYIQSVQFADVPIMTAYLVMAALIFVVINFTVDVLYAAIDPRLRAERVAAGRA